MCHNIDFPGGLCSEMTHLGPQRPMAWLFQPPPCPQILSPVLPPISLTTVLIPAMIEQSENNPRTIPSHCRLLPNCAMLKCHCGFSLFFPVLALGSKANCELPSLDVPPQSAPSSTPPNHSNLNGKGEGGGRPAKSSTTPLLQEPRGSCWSQGKAAPSFILS